MNKQDVVNAVAQKTGLQPAVCEKVINAAQGQYPGALASEFFVGSTARHTEIVAGISARTGVPETDCEKVVSALERVVKNTLWDKLSLLMRIFQKY